MAMDFQLFLVVYMRSYIFFFISYNKIQRITYYYVTVMLISTCLIENKQDIKYALKKYQQLVYLLYF